MSKIQRNIILAVVALVVLFGGGYYTLNRDKQAETTTKTTQEKVETITISVKSDGVEKKYPVEGMVGKTALEASEKVLTLEKSGEGENAFITNINGRVANSSKKEFWKLVINGEDASVRAGSYTILKGDSISWEIDTF